MSTLIKGFTAATFTAFLLFTEVAPAEDGEVLWLGHGTVRITSTTGKVIMIDAFLKKNPQTPAQYKDLKALGEVDLILITHGHIDHVDSLEELAQLTGATVVANFELANQLVAMGVLDKANVIGMNKGGTVTPLGRGIEVHMVPADHSSSLDFFVFTPPDLKAKLRHLDAGAAVGYVIKLENGFSIYASGDTNVFGDMALINRFHAPDLALVCIGGHFTMGPEGAAYAVRELIKPKQVIPIHYGTYPMINRTPAEFKPAESNDQCLPKSLSDLGDRSERKPVCRNPGFRRVFSAWLRRPHANDIDYSVSRCHHTTPLGISARPPPVCRYN